jgi:hypothetical protein
VIWVEILGRHHDVIARHRCDGVEVRIGRGYDNDVVIDDPFVAPSHLRVFRGDDGTLVAEDLGSANGLRVGDGGAQPRVVVDGDRPLRIGRTLVRIRQADHAVAPERAAAPGARMWPRAIALATAVFAIELLSSWLTQTTEQKPSRQVLSLVAIAGVVLVWTTAWAILNRIFAGHARFERHLVIALTALLALSIADELVDLGAFALSWRVLADFSYVGAWTMFAALCYFHLREIGPAHQKLKAAIVFGLGAAAVVTQTLSQYQYETGPWVSRQSYVRKVYPPFLRLVAPQDDDSFFAGAGRLQADLDRARKEEAPSDGYSGIGGDD